VEDDVRDALSQRYGRVHPSAAPIYLGSKTPQRIVEAGLTGALADPEGGRMRAAVVALALSLAAVLGIAALFRALTRRAALERAERVLDEEWRALARTGRP
jgi:hypothetical protein